MAVLETFCVLVVAFSCLANGQVDLIPNRPSRPTTLGVFDGQIVQMDETLVPARGQMSQFGGRPGERGSLSSRRDPAGVLNLIGDLLGAGQRPRDRNNGAALRPENNVLGRPLGPLSKDNNRPLSRRGSARGLNLKDVLGAGLLPRSLRRGQAQLPDRNVLERPSGSALPLPTESDLQRCPRTSCSAQVIPRRCRYTPVQIGPQGDYCLGCPEDICPRADKLARRRERWMRRRVCRVLGICFGEDHSAIPDVPGNHVV